MERRLLVAVLVIFLILVGITLTHPGLFLVYVLIAAGLFLLGLSHYDGTPWQYAIELWKRFRQYTQMAFRKKKVAKARRSAAPTTASAASEPRTSRPRKVRPPITLDTGLEDLLEDSSDEPAPEAASPTPPSRVRTMDQTRQRTASGKHHRVSENTGSGTRLGNIIFNRTP